MSGERPEEPADEEPAAGDAELPPEAEVGATAPELKREERRCPEAEELATDEAEGIAEDATGVPPRLGAVGLDRAERDEGATVCPTCDAPAEGGGVPLEAPVPLMVDRGRATAACTAASNSVCENPEPPPTAGSGPTGCNPMFNPVPAEEGAVANPWGGEGAK